MPEKNYRLALAQALLDCIDIHEASWSPTLKRYMMSWSACAELSCKTHEIDSDKELIAAMCCGYSDFPEWAQRVVKGE